jgi:hypothetical protein
MVQDVTTMTSPLLELPELLEAQPNAHLIFNTNLRIMEALVVARIVDTALATPPGSPAESSVYFVATSPTGAWSGKAGELAIYIQGAWYFVPLYTGQEFYVVSATARQRWNGSAWV